MDRKVIGASVEFGGEHALVGDGAARDGGHRKYFDDVWEIHHVDSGENYVIDFRTRFGDLRDWQQQVAKNIVYLRCVEDGGRLTTVSSQTTLRNNYAGIASIFHFFNIKFGGRTFDGLSEDDLVGLTIDNIDGSLASHGTVFGRVRLLRWMYDLRLTEHRMVPIKYLPSLKVSLEWEKHCKARVKEAGQNYAEWRNGGSFDIVPFEISLAVLSYCLQLIQSDETRYLLAWFQTERRLHKEGRPPVWRAASRMLARFGARSGDYGPREEASYMDEVFFQELRKFYPDAKTRDQLPLPAVPFGMGTHSDRNSLRRKADHLLAACYLSILILTGIRHGEASGMASDAFRKNGFAYTFSSNIDKTNHGVVTDRHVSDVVADFIDVLDGLGSYSLADDRREDLFSYGRCSLNDGNIRSYSLRGSAANAQAMVNSFYEIFLEERGDDYRIYCPKVTAHAFRHAWAEFAMRRFDGNIMPLIRDHYRHHFGSKMTGAYTHNKIELSEYQNLGKRHLVELVSRYVGGFAALHGQVGEFLAQQADGISLIEMHDKVSRDDAISEIIEEHFGEPIITPHEYGLCVLTEKTKHLANCRDEAGIPKTQTADINNCAGCVNSCMVKQCDGNEDTHFLTLKRLLAAYQAEAKEWQDNEQIGPLFLDEAQKTRRAIEALVGKMEKANV